MKRYLTGMITTDYNRFKSPPYRGAGWSIEYTEKKDAYAEQYHAVWKAPDASRIENPRKELVVCATNEETANHAAFLVAAAFELWAAYPLFQDFGFVPVVVEEDDARVRQDHGAPHVRECVQTDGFPWAGQIAAKASRRLDHVYALTKWKLSAQTFCVLPIDLNPRHTSTIPKPKHVSDSVAIAYALILAYSVIEQLRLELRASAKKPRNIGDAWNPDVREELQKRLVASGVDLNEQMPWNVRGSKTRLERNRPKFIFTMAKKALWSRWDVRDRMVDVVDAIAHGAWLRNCVSAHYLDPKNAKALSVYDVANVQGLARRLLLQTLGFWRNHPRPRRPALEED
jgi:hypothetical protein